MPETPHLPAQHRERKISDSRQTASHPCKFINFSKGSFPQCLFLLFDPWPSLFFLLQGRPLVQVTAVRNVNPVLGTASRNASVCVICAQPRFSKSLLTGNAQLGRETGHPIPLLPPPCSFGELLYETKTRPSQRG